MSDNEDLVAPEVTAASVEINVEETSAANVPTEITPVDKMSGSEDLVAPEVAADSVEINREKTSGEDITPEITSEITVEVGIKRERSPSEDTHNDRTAPHASVASDAPDSSVNKAQIEVKVAPRERKSRFSEKPAELPVTSEPTAMANSIASVCAAS